MAGGAGGGAALKNQPPAWGWDDAGFPWFWFWSMVVALVGGLAWLLWFRLRLRRPWHYACMAAGLSLSAIIAGLAGRIGLTAFGLASWFVAFLLALLEVRSVIRDEATNT